VAATFKPDLAQQGVKLLKGGGLTAFDVQPVLRSPIRLDIELNERSLSGTLVMPRGTFGKMPSDLGSRTLVAAKLADPREFQRHSSFSSANAEHLIEQVWIIWRFHVIQSCITRESGVETGRRLHNASDIGGMVARGGGDLYRPV
jgi:hypothetical protein